MTNIGFKFSDYLLVKSHININSSNSRASDDIDLKLELVTSRDQRNMTTSKNSVMSCWQIMLSLSVFGIMADFVQFRSLIQKAWIIII